MLRPNKVGLQKLTKQNMEDAPEDTIWVESVKSTVNTAIQRLEDIRGENGINLIHDANVQESDITVQVPDPWIKVGVTAGAPSFKNGWIDFSAAVSDTRFYKDDDGVVEVRIGLAGGAGIAGTAVFTLPSQYWPSTPVAFSVQDLNLAAPAVYAASIDTSGNVIVYTASADALWGQVRFLSLDATPIQLSCWPQSVKVPFKQVAAVLVARVQDGADTKPLRAGAVFQPEWEMTTLEDSPAVRLLNIPGLPYNRKSLVKLFIIGE